MRLQPFYRLSATAIGYIIRLSRFTAILIVFFVTYRLLLEQLLDGAKQIIPLLGLWILTSYIVLPRVHRLLTKYYLPNYFVGRIRSPSGLLSDPVNIAFYGEEKSIHEALNKAGWHRAEKLTPKTLFKTAYCAFFHKSYPTAPVGDMFLFNRRYDFAYQKQVGGSPNERHHVRFWKVPEGWRLPGGHDADWLAAATYDTKVGIKIATGQIDHYIHKEVDEERDYLVNDLKKTNLVKKVYKVEHFTDAYHDHNNGGDRIQTDGALPFVSL